LKRRPGLSDLMICDMVGMSVDMVKVYTRFENKHESGKAALVMLGDHTARKNAARSREGSPVSEQGEDDKASEQHANGRQIQSIV
jgi:hypothetical protein